MIIIAFAQNTSKLLPKITCRHFRHCAPIVPTSKPGKNLVMYQFIHKRHIEQIPINMRDIKLLRAHGWQFVYIPRDLPHQFNPNDAYSCVDLSKRAIGLNARTIWRPDALYKYLNEN